MVQFHPHPQLLQKTTAFVVSLSCLVLLTLMGMDVDCLAPTTFTTTETKDADNLIGLRFVSRFVAPFGPPVGETYIEGSSGPLTGYGFGMGALDAAAYDPINHYFYAASEHKYVSVFDYGDPTRPTATDFVLDFNEGNAMGNNEGEISDVKLCAEQGLVFVSNIDAGLVDTYSIVRRDDPKQPTLLASTKVSDYPDVILPNADCSILAVMSEHDESLFYSELTLVRDLDFYETGKPGPTATKIPLDSGANDWDDDYVLRKGIHMPLTNKSLEYWDDVANEHDFSQARGAYRSSLFISGESLAWAPNQKELLVNLQKNNGILRLDAETNRPLDLAGYGLKDHGEIAIDINGEDKKCDRRTYPNLFAMRNPDMINTFSYNGRSYILTANEGSNRDYEDFEDSIKVKDLFQGQTFGLPGFSVWPSVFNANETLGGRNAMNFNSDCQGIACVGDLEVSVGSTSIDYETDPTNPVLERLVMFGGRGFTVYELPDNPSALLKLVYDSGDTVEKEICEQMPWAHNSEQSDAYAPAADFPNNTLWTILDDDDREELLEYNDPTMLGCVDQGDGTPGACPYSETVDRTSGADGHAVEAVISGVACGRLISFVTTEKSSVAMLYDMTDITQPELKQMFHLSPGSVYRSPGLAYNDGTIGEVDPEITMFLSDDESPSGKAGILIAGAHSGTISFWEFECADSDPMQA